MDYLSRLASCSFETDSDGNHLFCLGGPFCRPYILPDVAEKERLQRKLTSFYRVFLPAVTMVAMVFARYICTKPIWFFSLLIGGIPIQLCTDWLLFHKDLKGLKRSNTRSSFTEYFVRMAQRLSCIESVFWFAISLMFAAWGISGVVLYEEDYPLSIRLAVAILSVLMAVAYGYVLILRIRKATPNKGIQSTPRNGA